MKKFFKELVIAGIFTAVIISCSKLDVVAKDSVRAFGDVFDAFSPDNIAQDELTGAFTIISPDRSANFMWASDFFNGVGDFSETADDIVIFFDAAPFIAAGLDVEKLPETIRYGHSDISIGANLGDKKSENKLSVDGSKKSALAAYQHIISKARNRLSYHSEFDHYSISIGDGNFFEWAKDLKTNDKGIVFVLNPEPFISAGVDPNKIEGWLFTKVTGEDEDDKPVQVDKLLKAFDLR
jgi:hypothetical protein